MRSFRIASRSSSRAIHATTTTERAFRTICAGVIAGLTLAGAGTVGCQSTPSAATPMVADGKEAIYGFLSQGSTAMADEALADIWDIGSRAAPVTLRPITWNDDPADKYWRFIFYGLRPLTNLLYAYYTTGNVAYRDKLLEVVRSFVAFDAQRGTALHPFLDEPHTACFRAMMLVNIYGKLSRSGDLPDDVAAGMRASIEKVSAFLALEDNFQDHENHGFNEAAALLLASVNFPQMAKAAEWKATALARLDKLASDAVDGDGVEIENSPFYQFYVLSFVQQDSRWMAANGIEKPAGFDARIASMFEYATYSTQPDGYAPLLGASVKLNVHKLLPKIYSTDGDGAGGIDDPPSTFEFVRDLGASGDAPTARNKRFPASGQSFLRSSFGTKGDYTNQTWVSFNVGNHRNAHNHFDALGITYYANGKPLLPDAGLYEYESEVSPQPIQSYFLSTRAHNTVVVDGGDQPVSTDALVVGGAVLEGGDWLYQSGRHTLYPGVTHRRSVIVLKRDVTVVLDSLESVTAHEYTQTWHFEPQATTSVNGLDVVAAGSDGKPELAVRQAVLGEVSLSVVKGQESPVIQGFHSEQYDNKVPNYVAEYHTTATQAGFATLLASGDYASASATVRADYDRANDTVTASVCAGDVKLTVTVAHQAGDGESVSIVPSTDCR